MRLIRLDVINGITQNVKGASNSFFATNGDLIADYDGEDDSIPTYTAETRPVYVAPITYLTRVSNQEFLSLVLHPDEFDRLVKYAKTDSPIDETEAAMHDAIIMAFTRIQTRELGNVVFDNLEYIALVESVYALGMIEPLPTELERRDDLLKGFRLSGLF